LGLDDDFLRINLGYHHGTSDIKVEFKDTELEIEKDELLDGVQAISEVLQLKHSVDVFTDTELQLHGESYDSIRNYYSSTHLPAIRGLVCHLENLKSANNQYTAQIDVYFGGIGFVDDLDKKSNILGTT